MINANFLLSSCYHSLYSPLSSTGEGSYSQVFKVQRGTDNKTYALKKVSMDALSTRERNNALNEVRILASIDHANIVQYKEAFTDNEKTLCVVMEFADDGDLYQKITEYRKQKQRLEER